MKRQYIDFQLIKQVPIENILRYLGIEKAATPKSSTKGAWYFSPFRRETHPSIHVLVGPNYWIDFGTGEKGTNIDLILRLDIAADCYSAAQWIFEHFVTGVGAVDDTIHFPSPATMPEHGKEPRVRLLSVRAISSSKLVDYFARRGISRDILCAYCQEVYYSIGNSGERFGAGIPNIKGGYAVRTPWGKVTVGQSGVTLFRGEDHSCLVFEGMTNMLSYVVLYGRPSADIMVLNSTGNVKAAIELMREYSKIDCVLDNDAAGREATHTILLAMGEKTIDCSGLYAGFNDINDYIINNQIHTL